MKTDDIISKMLGKKKGASVAKQKQWKGLTPKKKTVLRKKYKDTDRDGVPNKWDCQPFNRKKQDDEIYEGRCPECGSFVSESYQPPTGGIFMCKNKKCKYYNKMRSFDMSSKIV